MIRRFIPVLLIVLLLAAVGCTKKEEAYVPEGPLWKPKGNEGNITGKIKFTGTAPVPAKLDMSQDSSCQGSATSEEIAVKDGALKNVFVYIKSGLPKASFETPVNEAELDQKGCLYVPHVLGVQVGQKLKVVNSDHTDHNVKTVQKINSRWDQPQLLGQAPLTHVFKQPEVMIPVKCQRHPWMLAYVGVLPHPFYAVTKDDGTFSIKGLPPGDYEIEAWHEKLGTHTAKITVKEKADAPIEINFLPSTARTHSSLKMQPALILQ